MSPLEPPHVADATKPLPAAPPAAPPRSPAGAAPPTSPTPPPRRWRRWLVIALLVIALAALAMAGYLYALAAQAPDLDDLQPRTAGQTSVVLAADGSRLGAIPAPVIRTPVRASELPKVLRQATVAIEDRRFYEHDGVDMLGVLRAAARNLRGGEVAEGASTLEMQLVRNLYASDERTLARKVREAKLAQELSDRRSKEQILTDYLNNVPYTASDGQEAIGAQAAARVLFDKPARDLDLHEAALLAGLPQAPTALNPHEHPQAAKRRRDQVLTAMQAEGYITVQQARDAAAQPVRVRDGGFYDGQRERFFFQFVRNELEREYGKHVVQRGGLRVYTTVEPRLQRLARAAIRQHLSGPDAPDAAVVTINPRNGHIQAMVTSAGPARRFNLASQARRQPGSTFKTMVLVAALRKGIDPRRTFYTSKPFQDPAWGQSTVKTYDDTYPGKINLVDATLRSDNSVYAQLDLDVGPENVAKAARDMGVRAQLEGLPAEGLGGLRRGVSPLEMASSYATLAAGGVRARPVAIRRVTFPDRTTRRPDPVVRERALTPAIAHTVTEILQRNVRRGTATAAQINCPAAAKTGTTENFRDAWLVGYTPRMSTSVWVGHASSKPMPGVSGGGIPARIWGAYMQPAAGDGCGQFPAPAQPADLDPYCEGRAVTTRGCPLTAAQQRQRQQRKERQRDRDQRPPKTSRRERPQPEPEPAPAPEPEPAPRPAEPDTTITAATRGVTRQRIARFRFTSDRPDATFECQFDDGQWLACDSPEQYNQVLAGQHTFRVRAVVRGRHDQSPAETTWTVDR